MGAEVADVCTRFVVLVRAITAVTQLALIDLQICSRLFSVRFEVATGVVHLRVAIIVCHYLL